MLKNARLTIPLFLLRGLSDRILLLSALFLFLHLKSFYCFTTINLPNLIICSFVGRSRDAGDLGDVIEG